LIPGLGGSAAAIRPAPARWAATRRQGG
jgi:hypothetical protein